MKILRLEKHSYACELNKALIGNRHAIVEIPAPACATIRDVRELFKPAPLFTKIVTVVFSSVFGDKEYTGRIANYSELPKFIAGRLKAHTILKESIHHDNEMCFESKVLSLSIVSKFGQ